jgi:hypothetical protein
MRAWGWRQVWKIQGELRAAACQHNGQGPMCVNCAMGGMTGYAFL